MFRLECLGGTYEPLEVDEVCTAINTLRDVEVHIVDLREGGKAHHLTIGLTGSVHETYGSRLVIHDARLLLKTPGRPVYASQRAEPGMN
ncbi:hypothetical protein [Burkholderia sp. Tr-20390]|uniref:hypothetical protein n=1 Tax=Burkholderia sp. Tr-20390 TaxID=2703904 RepID=UPI00197CE5DF|nr:hypothetical protein [Burkholderia sp. Tr-20390]MBN3729331.1 hypothetical protein [Burkholderia sp. Tr-20390]